MTKFVAERLDLCDNHNQTGLQSGKKNGHKNKSVVLCLDNLRDNHQYTSRTSNVDLK